MSASELLKAHEKDIKRNHSHSACTSAPPTQNGTPDTPMLGRGLAPGSDLFFDESPNIKKRKSNDVERAKVRVCKAFLLIHQFKTFLPIFSDKCHQHHVQEFLTEELIFWSLCRKSFELWL